MRVCDFPHCGKPAIRVRVCVDLFDGDVDDEKLVIKTEEISTDLCANHRDRLKGAIGAAMAQGDEAAIMGDVA